MAERPICEPARGDLSTAVYRVVSFNYDKRLTIWCSQFAEQKRPPPGEQICTIQMRWTKGKPYTKSHFFINLP